MGFSALLYCFVDYEETELIVRASYVGMGVLAVFLGVNWIVIFPVMGARLVNFIRMKCAKSKKKKSVTLDKYEDFNFRFRTQGKF